MYKILVFIEKTIQRNKSTIFIAILQKFPLKNSDIFFVCHNNKWCAIITLRGGFVL